jgi:ribosomal protein S18 acetylase RimI-like enzyme
VIRLEEAARGRALARFLAFPREVYRDDPFWRATEDDVVEMLVRGHSAYLSHAAVRPFLLLEDARVLARFSLIQDRRMPGWVQVAHFEALPGIADLRRTLFLKARVLFPDCDHVVVGLHGHLNYGAGFLVAPHGRPPVFGLPYTPRYYLDYFEGLDAHDMVSFSFENEGFYELARRVAPGLDLGGIRIRKMDRRFLARETDLYTWLNNESFQRHPFWSNRSSDEDFELFHPFRHFLDEENLIFAEEAGKPVGFLLWYPDFNELVPPGGRLGLRPLLRYRLANPIRTVRLTEIGVHPSCRNRGVVPGLIMHMIRSVEAGGYRLCEGGFIFEANKDSLSMTLRYLARALGEEIAPSRRFRVFEGRLTGL